MRLQRRGVVAVLIAWAVLLTIVFAPAINIVVALIAAGALLTYFVYDITVTLWPRKGT